MFKSKVRPIVIPQFEHARLAGTMALMWGNDQFDRPEIDFDKFVEGVTLHDWQYGHIDTLSLGDASEEAWLELMASGVDLEFADPTVEVVAKLHMKRLLRRPVSIGRQDLAKVFEDRISQVVAKNNLSREKFEWADSITRFCDSFAFDFAYGEPTSWNMPISAKTTSREKTSIGYELKANGLAHVHPWPFSAPSISGVISGYQLYGYPERLVPEAIQFHIKPIKQ